VAPAFDAPELEGQAGAQGVLGRDHPGAREVSGACQLVQFQADQVGHEEEKPAAAGGHGARGEGKRTHVGDGLGRGAQSVGSFLVEASGEGCKTLLLEDLAHGGGAQEHVAALELLADLVDRVVLLAQLHDQVPGG